jgi:hypothetical protein
LQAKASAKTFQLPTSLVNTTWKNAFTGEIFTLKTSLDLNPDEYFVLVK